MVRIQHTHTHTHTRVCIITYISTICIYYILYAYTYIVYVSIICLCLVVLLCTKYYLTENFASEFPRPMSLFHSTPDVRRLSWRHCNSSRDMAGPSGAAWWPKGGRTNSACRCFSAKPRPSQRFPGFPSNPIDSWTTRRGRFRHKARPY